MTHRWLRHLYSTTQIDMFFFENTTRRNFVANTNIYIKIILAFLDLLIDNRGTLIELHCITNKFDHEKKSRWLNTIFNYHICQF